MKMPNRTLNSEKSLIDPTKAKQVISRGKMEEAARKSSRSA